MKPIESDQRLVKSIDDAAYQPFVSEGRFEAGQTVLQLDDQAPLGTGFHIFKMAPGATTTAHEHQRDEHFVVIDGDLTDHDGYEYRLGDIVLLKQRTRHNSTTRNGCTLVVFF